MGNSDQKKYVDSDKLKMAILNMPIPCSSNYSNGNFEREINQMISSSLINSFTQLQSALVNAIDQAAVPYDKCMLCVQRDSCVPDHPLGENR